MAEPRASESMSKQNKLVAVPRSHPREGEGYVVESARRLVPMPDGTQSVQIQFELSTVPVPDRKYHADAASVRYINGNVELMFGQRTISGKSLRSLVVVNSSSMGALLFLNSCSKIRSGFQSFVQRSGLTDQLDSFEEEPSQTVALTANVFLMAYSGREACLDLYFASPYMMSRLSKNEQFAIEPVVRITLSTGLAWSAFLELEQLREKFPAEEVAAVDTLGGAE